MSFNRFVELGKEFGTSLTVDPLDKAEKLWSKAPKEEREEAKAAFYKAAEDAQKEVKLAKKKKEKAAVAVAA